MGTIGGSTEVSAVGDGAPAHAANDDDDERLALFLPIRSNLPPIPSDTKGIFTPATRPFWRSYLVGFRIRKVAWHFCSRVSSDRRVRSCIVQVSSEREDAGDLKYERVLDRRLVVVGEVRSSVASSSSSSPIRHQSIDPSGL